MYIINTIITINFIINLCWLCVYHSIWKASNHVIIILEYIIVILGIWHVIAHTFILSLVHSIAKAEHTTCADHTLIHILTDLCTNHWLLHKHYTLVHYMLLSIIAHNVIIHCLNLPHADDLKNIPQSCLSTAKLLLHLLHVLISECQDLHLGALSLHHLYVKACICLLLYMWTVCMGW